MTASVVTVGLFAVSSGTALIPAGFFLFFFSLLHYSYSAAFGSGDVVIIFRICLSTSSLPEAFQRSTGMAYTLYF